MIKTLYICLKDIVKYLLKHDHNSEKLIEDKSFVFNLMTLAKTAPSQKITENIG